MFLVVSLFLDMDHDEEEIIEHMFQQWVNMVIVGSMFFFMIYGSTCQHYRKYMLKNKTFVRKETHIEIIDRLIRRSDVTCIEQLRMDRRTFGILCELLRTAGGLKVTGDVILEEQVAMFLYIISHHFKNRVTKHYFRRSGETVSRHFNAVLNAVLPLQGILLKAPEPVPNNSSDEKWKWFKVCEFLFHRSIATFLSLY